MLQLMSSIEVGVHWYWEVFGLVVHGQVFAVTDIVIVAIITVFCRRKGLGCKTELFAEGAYEYLSDIVKAQVGPAEYRLWLPFVGTLFLFVFAANWWGVLVPWKLIRLPVGELAAPTNDINVTVALALMTSFSYFGAGIKKKGGRFFMRYVMPSPVFLPITLLEDFAKPLSLSFRLFGNVLADEILVSVLCMLVPLFVPLAVMCLGALAGAVQALVFALLSAAYVAEAME
jgi:F-type H+-transporting ATPase subunit a